MIAFAAMSASVEQQPAQLELVLAQPAFAEQQAFAQAVLWVA